MTITVISDTHGRHESLVFSEQTDMLIHCGDFSSTESSFYKFIEWYAGLNFKYKILIAGNHDEYVYYNQDSMKQICKEYDIIYLQDEKITIENINFYGSPYSLQFMNWFFMESEYKLEAKWNNIPENTDILITHGPSYSELDKVKNRCTGSQTLYKRKKELNLKYHLFGHIHEDFGIAENSNYNNQIYMNINASQFIYEKPYVFEIIK